MIKSLIFLVQNYVGFELDREMIMEEAFALEKSSNKIHFKLWDKYVIKYT